MDVRPPIRATFGNFLIDESEVRFECDGEAVGLAPRAFAVLCELMRHPGQLVSKDALLDAVWGHRHINEAALKNIISQLRSALNDDAREARYIQTVSRKGYRFIAPLESPDGGVQSLPKPQPQPQDPGTTDPTWVGRDQVLNQIMRALEGPTSEHRPLVFIAGEAGIGKSTLVERIMASTGFPVAYGQCIEHYGGAEPYMPVLEALNGLCRGQNGPVWVELMRRVAPNWMQQLPWFVSDGNTPDLMNLRGNATQERMLREFGEFMDRVTQTQPILLVLEDLHWCDHATVQLLGYMAMRRPRAALTIVGTFRATDLIVLDHPLAGLRQTLRQRSLCAEFNLEYLSEVDIADYLAAKQGVPAPEWFVQQLHQHTMGLPLFVVAVIDELSASGQLSYSEQGWQLPRKKLTVPETIAAMIDGQLRRLTQEQRRILDAASVGGIDFAHSLLADVLQIPASAVEGQLTTLAKHLPWIRSGEPRKLGDGRLAVTFNFAHSVYRNSLYEQISALQRIQWHRDWARALTSTLKPGQTELAAELALHLERGDMRGEAAAQLAIVATRALARGAPQEAIQAARHALQWPAEISDSGLRLELHVLEGVALTRQREITDIEVIQAFNSARTLGPHDTPAWQRALQGCWWIHYAKAEFKQALTLADEMLQEAQRQKSTELRLAGLNAMGLVFMVTGELNKARHGLEEALAVYDSLGTQPPTTSFVQDPGVEASLALALVYWICGEPRKARELMREAIRLAQSHHHPLSEATALYGAAILHAQAGEYDVVHSLTETIFQIVREYSLPERGGGHAWLHGQALVERGCHEAGLAEMREAAQAVRTFGAFMGLCSYHYHYALACLKVGAQSDAMAAIDEGVKLMGELGETMMLPALLTLKAQMEYAGEQVVSASQSLQLAIAHAKEHGAAFHEIQAQTLALNLALPFGDLDRLRQLTQLYEGDSSPLLQAAFKLCRA